MAIKVPSHLCSFLILKMSFKNFSQLVFYFITFTAGLILNPLDDFSCLGNFFLPVSKILSFMIIQPFSSAAVYSYLFSFETNLIFQTFFLKYLTFQLFKYLIMKILNLQTGILINFFPLHQLFLFILLEIALTFLYIEFFHLAVSFCVIPFLKHYIPTSWIEYLCSVFFFLMVLFLIHSPSHTNCFVCLFICCLFSMSYCSH